LNIELKMEDRISSMAADDDFDDDADCGCAGKQTFHYWIVTENSQRLTSFLNRTDVQIVASS
jgi:hypothetical protein